jgi:phosphate starvation-inducible PhoH-like protein
MPTAKRLSRKERRTQRQASRQHNEGRPQAVTEKLNFNLKHVSPLTLNQERTFEAWGRGGHLLLTGTAGTGKSFLTIYLGMQAITEEKEQNKMIIIRSVVPTRDMGFLPGSNKEKSKVYEAPYYSIFSELFERSDAYEYLKNKNVVEFMTTSFVRGITINDAIIVVDELQNMTPGELHSVFTRIGKNCRVVFAGDIKQNDLNPRKEESGFKDFFKVINKLNSFTSIEFDRDDIVRSSIVREYIIAREELEDRGSIAPL